ncbi:MAG: radical SAM protein [Thermotaleaceae bacterium]
MILLDEEVYILPYEKALDKKLIYAPVRGWVELIEENMADRILSSNIASQEDLKENSHLNSLIKALQKMPLKDLDGMQKGLPMLNIDLSTGCNMRCIYCYAGRGDGGYKFQQKEHIDRILDAYFHHLYASPCYKERTTCWIAFTNDAEPTFVPDLLRYTVMTAIEKAKTAKIKPIFVLPTNGAFDDGLRAFIIQHFHIVSISFEGLPWVQNLHRPFVKGEPSFHRVFENSKALFKSGMKVCFSGVVTRHNLYHLKDTIDFFHEHFPGSMISFGQVNLIGRASGEQMELAVDQQSFDEQLLCAIRYAESTSIKVQVKHGSIHLNPRRHYCSSTARPNWSVSLSGDMYACMEEKSESMKIGRYDFNQNQMHFNDEKIRSLGERNVNCSSRCEECFAKYLCAGGCISKDENQAALCEGIRQRCLYFINKAYENKRLKKEVQQLFKISEE